MWFAFSELYEASFLIPDEDLVNAFIEYIKDIDTDTADRMNYYGTDVGYVYRPWDKNEYDILTNAKEEEEKELEEENMTTNNDEYGITKTYEFDDDVFVPGDVYCIRQNVNDICFRYFAIFERFDNDDRAVFVSKDNCDCITSYDIISGTYMIQPVLSIHDYLTNNDMDFHKKFGLKETYEVDPNVFQIGAAYLIKDTTVSYESSYLGILRNVVLNPKNEESYVKFMSDVSDKPIKLYISEIGETYLIKLVTTVKDLI